MTMNNTAFAAVAHQQPRSSLPTPADGRAKPGRNSKRRKRRQGGRGRDQRARVEPHRVEPHRAEPHRAEPHRAEQHRAEPRRAGLEQARIDEGAALLRVEGMLELHPEGFGFLRNPSRDCLPAPDDGYVPAGLIASAGLRTGDLIVGEARPQHGSRGSRGPSLSRIALLNGRAPGEQRASFAALTAINPEAHLRLETGPAPLSTRVIDLLVPLGRGQRGLIVAPPRSGKTVLLQQIGEAVAANHPDVQVVVLLIDERPEEVTDMRRRIPGRVFASSLDRDVENHVRLSRLVVEYCKRQTEQGGHVLLLLDSVTRMSRAFNKWVGNTGRTMSGGVDIRALDIPKQLFASARAFEEGGSLTILATALVETGSRMDDLIFEEFKGTGNFELVLDRQLADRRIWPAIDIGRSGTRREEKLLPADVLQTVASLRRVLSNLRSDEAMPRLAEQLAKHNSNAEFLRLLQTRAAAA